MSNEHPENPPETPPEPDVTRETIREALTYHLQTRQQERIEAEKAERRAVRDGRAKKRKEALVRQAREEHAKRLRVLAKAESQMMEHATEAAKSLKAALRIATQIKMPRQSSAGQHHLRSVRALESAVAALRRIGRVTYGDPDELTDLSTEIDSLI